MKENDPQPKNSTSGNRPPPRPPGHTAVGVGPDGDESGKHLRATITMAAKGEGKFIRQSGYIGHYAHVLIEIEPRERSHGVEIITDVSDSAIPAEYLKSVTHGIRQALAGGLEIGDSAVDGRPIVDLVVRVVGGSFHIVNSSDLVFQMASIFAIKDAVKKAKPVLIE